MIALVTTDLSGQSIEDVDRPPLEQAFAAHAAAEFVNWDDPDVDWAGYRLVVLRSTWDYQARLPQFRQWLARVGALTRLLNSPPTVAWNLDKRYLGALAAGGVPVVRTSYLDDLPGFDAALAGLEAGQIVVKPTVSMGSDHTGRFERRDPAARQLAGQILALGKRVMLQPYYESVSGRGEVSLVHFDGIFSHAFGKGPVLELGGGFLGGEYTEVVRPVAPSSELLAVAHAVLSRYAELAGADPVLADPVLAGARPLLYSRVDLIEDDEGRSRCLELELIEPSFFFSTAEGAAGRFVQAVLRRL